MTTPAHEELLMQLHQCATLLHRGRLQEGQQSGAMHHGQGRLLFLLNKMEGASQTDLVKILDSRPASVSELIDKLEKLELVDRRRSNNDRRKVNLFLTDKGRETVSDAEAARSIVISDIFDDFSEDEVQQLSSLLNKLSTKLEKINKPAVPGNKAFGTAAPDPETVKQ